MSATYDVLGIGNAIVDVIARTEDDFLVKHGMNKGSMALIDEARAEAIYASMGSATQSSGGSGANTIAGIASFGARAAFVGKVKDDAPGKAFTHDIRAMGVAYTTQPASDGPSTARCYVLVTPDGERTMNTYLGAAQNLTPADLDEKQIAAARYIYLEGYLWDPPQAKEAFRKAAEIAHKASRKVALTLSDAFCVGRYRDEFLNLMRTGTVDLVFANESELKSLYETADFDSAVTALRNDVKLAVVTRSEKGSVVISREANEAVPAAPIGKLVDATGAGDLFAAGFLTGLARDMDHRNCARLGALAAAEVIQHLGARPETSLKTLAQDAGLTCEPLFPVRREDFMQPLNVTVVQVTPFQQNCSIVTCTATNRAAIVDPGGDVANIRAAIDQLKVTPEKIWLTHGHIDHAGGAAELAQALSLPIEGPDERDGFLLENLEAQGVRFGIDGIRNVKPTRWLVEGETVSVGDLTFDVLHVPGHTPGHLVFVNTPSRFALVGDTLFQGSVGRTDFPYGDSEQLIEGIKAKLLPLGDDVTILPGHGPASTIGAERRGNGFLIR